MSKNDANSRRILVLHAVDDRQARRPCIEQHLRALACSAHGHRILYHNCLLGMPAFLRRAAFDVVILHTTLLCYRWSHWESKMRALLGWLRDCPSVKIAIPQDEYDWPDTLDDWLDEMNVSVICTNFGSDCRALFYPKMQRRARFLRCLTGYIDEAAASACALKIRPIAERPRDIVYRAAHLPFWYGPQGQLKHEIATVVGARARQLDLICDVSTRPEDAILSQDWYDFLGSGKTVLGCESGSSVLNRRGEIRTRIEAILAENPGLSYAEVSKLLPAGWADHRFYAIGPRHLEAIYTRTCQILVEGDYDGVLKAGRHYLALRRDFANLDEVLHMVRDHALLEATAERAYEEVYESKRYHYATFARILDAVVLRAPQRESKVSWAWLNRVHAWDTAVARSLMSCRAFLRAAVPSRVKAALGPVKGRLGSLLGPTT